MRPLRITIGSVWALVLALTACLFIPIGLGNLAWRKVQQPWARGALRILGVRFVIDGAAPAGPAIFIGNHETWVDVLLVPGSVPGAIRYVAKREIRSVPLVGWLLATVGGILVDRSNPEAAIRSIDAGIARLPKGWSLFIMPEGTRNRGEGLRPFKKGVVHVAIQSRLPVVPMGFAMGPGVMPEGATFPHPGTARVVFGAPIPTDAWSTDSLDAHLDLLVERVRACVAEASREEGEMVAQRT